MAREEMDDRALINDLFLRILNRPAKDGDRKSLSLFGGQIEGDHQKLVVQLGRRSGVRDWLELRNGPERIDPVGSSECIEMGKLGQGD